MANSIRDETFGVLFRSPDPTAKPVKEDGWDTKRPKWIRPFFGFYGGKWRDSPLNYPPPKHDIIVEPFAGSAGYSLRYYDRKIVLCEIDPVIFGIWDYLIRAAKSEILAIPDLNSGETVDDLDIPQEARWLVGFWLNRGTTRPRPAPSKWMREGIRPGSFWGPRVRNTIANQVDLIRHWRVINCSYEDCPDIKRATWFVDPPYQFAGRHYRYGSNLINYDKLAAWCRSRSGQTIVCENLGATWLPFTKIGDMKTTRSSTSPEVAWVFDEDEIITSESVSRMPSSTCQSSNTAVTWE